MNGEESSVFIELRTQYTINDPATEVIGVLGSCDALGNWAPCSAVLATPSSRDYWTATALLPCSTTVQWKWVLLDRATRAVKRWEERDNRMLTLAGRSMVIYTRWNRWEDFEHVVGQYQDPDLAHRLSKTRDKHDTTAADCNGNTATTYGGYHRRSKSDQKMNVTRDMMKCVSTSGDPVRPHSVATSTVKASGAFQSAHHPKKRTKTVSFPNQVVTSVVEFGDTDSDESENECISLDINWLSGIHNMDASSNNMDSAQGMFPSRTDPVFMNSTKGINNTVDAYPHCLSKSKEYIDTNVPFSSNKYSYRIDNDTSNICIDSEAPSDPGILAKDSRELIKTKADELIPDLVVMRTEDGDEVVPRGTDGVFSGAADERCEHDDILQESDDTSRKLNDVSRELDDISRDEDEIVPEPGEMQESDDLSRQPDNIPHEEDEEIWQVPDELDDTVCQETNDIGTDDESEMPDSDSEDQLETEQPTPPPSIFSFANTTLHIFRKIKSKMVPMKRDRRCRKRSRTAPHIDNVAAGMVGAAAGASIAFMVCHALNK